MTRPEHVLVEVLTGAAIEMPWPEEHIETWLVDYAARAVEGSVAVETAPSSSGLSLVFGDQRFLVARREPDQPPYAEADRRILAALSTMATASRHAARREARLRRAAHADDLTGLWHPNHFRELLETLVEDRGCETIAVLFLDVDRMKRLNEHLGHLDADEVLRELGSRLRSSVFPTGSFAGRTGGDEFAVAVRHVDDEAHLERILADLRALVREPVQVRNHVISVEVSIGEALAPPGEADAELLLRTAERRMRGQKRSRRPDTLPPRWYDDRTVLRDMLDQGRVEVAYQPMVDLRTREAVGFESLVRARHLELGPVSPLVLVGAAAKLQLLDELSEVVVEQSLAVASGVAAELGAPVGLAVNLEFEQLRADSRLLRSLPDRVAGTGVELVLEFSERGVARWTPAQREVAAELDDAGIGLAVDDFGTGYSALGLLTSWQWAWVKVDRAVVAASVTEAGRTVLGHVASMLADLDLLGVAEGVETQAELDAVLAAGLTRAQGTFFTGPVPGSAVLEQAGEHGLRLPPA